MALSKELKSQQISEIVEKIKNCKSFVLVNYKGVTVAQDTALRKNCRETGVEYKVYKNRLFLKALESIDLEKSKEYAQFLEESTAVAFANNDALAAAKAMSKASTEAKAIKIKCGMMDENFVDGATVNKLASIPSKEVLLAQLLGLLQSPISGLARTLQQIADNNANA